jgi:hypothetical protein
MEKSFVDHDVNNNPPPLPPPLRYANSILSSIAHVSPEQRSANKLSVVPSNSLTMQNTPSWFSGKSENKKKGINEARLATEKNKKNASSAGGKCRKHKKRTRCTKRKQRKTRKH